MEEKDDTIVRCWKEATEYTVLCYVIKDGNPLFD
jgi:hypothetical protein